MNTDDYKAVTAGVKGGEKLVLGFIAMYAEENKKVDSHALADDTGLSVKQIVRLTSKLKEAGRVHIEGGVGRAPYVYSLASANQDKMSAQVSQDKESGQDIKSLQGDGRADIMSSLADAKTKSPDNASGSQDKKSGTEVAPLSAETISSNNTPPSPSAQEGADAPPSSRRPRKVIQHPSAKAESDHQRLMRILAQRLNGIPDGGKQGKWAKWLLDRGYSVEECEECLDDLLAQEWRDTRVDWYEVSKQIGAWKARKNDEVTAEPKRVAVARGSLSPNVSPRTERQNRNASAAYALAAQRLREAEEEI